MKLTSTFFFNKKIIWTFLFYGLIVSLLFNSTIGKDGEYTLHYLLNFPVEQFFIPPLLLYFANNLGEPLSIIDTQIIRVLFSMMFWGIIGFIIQIIKNKN